MIDFNISLENADVLLRPMQKSDADAFYKVTSPKSVWLYFTSDLSDKNELIKWMDSALSALQKKARLPFTIIDKSTQTVIGSSSFGNISYRDSRVEIGWTWLGKEFQGKGFNQQVKFLMLEYAFKKCNMQRVEFKTDVLNTAARKALIKIGCIEEGTLRSHTLMTNNRRRDTIYYSILKNEWPEIKQKI